MLLLYTIVDITLLEVKHSRATPKKPFGIWDNDVNGITIEDLK